MSIQIRVLDISRDANGRIVSYRITDSYGRERVVSAKYLKQKLKNKEYICCNYKLTEDDRLVQVKSRVPNFNITSNKHQGYQYY